MREVNSVSEAAFSHTAFFAFVNLMIMLPVPDGRVMQCRSRLWPAFAFVIGDAGCASVQIIVRFAMIPRYEL